jgi:hypothetical protein
MHACPPTHEDALGSLELSLIRLRKKAFKATIVDEHTNTAPINWFPRTMDFRGQQCETLCHKSGAYLLKPPQD